MSDTFTRWWYENQMIHRSKKRKKKKAIVALAVIMAAELELLKKRSYSKKRYWTHSLWELRHQFGFYESIFPTLANSDEQFRKYMRMSLTQFENLLYTVGPMITKQFVVRVPIPAAARLAMTLRYVLV